MESFWERMLDARSIYRMLYSLRLIDSLIPAEADAPAVLLEKRLWCRKFYHSGGFKHLYHLLVRPDQVNPPAADKDALKSSIALSLKIIEYFMKGADTDASVSTSGVPPVPAIGAPAPDAAGIAAAQGAVQPSPQRAQMFMSTGTTRQLLASLDLTPFVRTLMLISWNIFGVQETTDDGDVLVVRQAIHLLHTSILANPATLLDAFLKFQVGPSVNTSLFLLKALHAPNQKLRTVLGVGLFELYSALRRHAGLTSFFVKLLASHLPRQEPLPYPVQSYDVYFDLLGRVIKQETASPGSPYLGACSELADAVADAIVSRPLVRCLQLAANSHCSGCRLSSVRRTLPTSFWLACFPP
jgi:hypothetical protein